MRDQILFENQTVKSVVTVATWKRVSFGCTCISKDEEIQLASSLDPVINKATNLADTVMPPAVELIPETRRRGVKQSLCDPELVMVAPKGPHMQDSISSIDSNLPEGEAQISLQYQCKSTSNTWTNRRKMCRKLKLSA